MRFEFRSRLMTDSITKPRYPNWRSAARQIWKEGGLRQVYRGFLPCMLRAFPTSVSIPSPPSPPSPSLRVRCTGELM